jgi:hypothetical protein
MRGAPATAPPATAAIIRQAAAALAQPSGTILHIAFTATQDNGDGTTASWSQESFSEQQPPYDSRMINTHLPGTPPGVEQATASGVSEIYDPTRNTIYVGPPPSPAAARNVRHYVFSRGETPGTYRVRVPVAFTLAGRASHKRSAGVSARAGTATAPRSARIRTIYRTMTVSASQAKRLRDGSDVIVSERRSGHGPITAMRVVPAARTSSAKDGGEPDPFSLPFRSQILALLRSGGVRVIGHSTVGGRDTIEIRSANGHTTYYVTPNGYTPVELTTRGTAGGTILRFDTYQELRAGPNAGLLSLTAQHPAATVDRDVADYRAADKRLFPHG